MTWWRLPNFVVYFRENRKKTEISANVFLCVFRDLNDKRALQGQKRCNKKCLKILLGSTMDGSGGGTKKLLPNRLNKYNTCDPFAHVMNHDCVDIVRCVALWETSIVIPATKPKKQQVILSCPKSKNTTLDAFHLCPPPYFGFGVSRLACLASAPFAKHITRISQNVVFPRFFFYLCILELWGKRRQDGRECPKNVLRRVENGINSKET